VEWNGREAKGLAETIETPALVIDEKILRNDLTLLRTIADRAFCKLLYSPKASSLATILANAAPMVDGFACSSPFELQLVDRVCDGTAPLHLVSPLIKRETLEAFGTRLSYVTFNSLSQWKALRAGVSSSTKVGLRINPELSFIRDPRYDPCRENSKLGVPVSRLARAVEADSDCLHGITGLHFHNNCESDEFSSLLATARHIQDAIPAALSKLEWINLGGGYLFESPDDCTDFYKAVQVFRDGFGLDVFMEPGAAAVRRCGTIVATVHDMFEGDNCPIAVLDSTLNHMPEVLEFQFEPDVLGHVDGGLHEYVLAGCTCLAGDNFGHYSFDGPLTVGSRITFLNMGAYTLSKAHRFNGVALPTIYVRGQDGAVERVRTDRFSDFAQHAGSPVGAVS
jgi:carboxynorspermidine decarboxylase